MQARTPPTNIDVPRSTFNTPSNSELPVFMAPWCFSKNCGIINPTNNDVPMMVIFRDDDRSTKCKVERPTDVTIPKLTRTIPPRTGSGMVVRNAPILPTMPPSRKIAPATRNADLLATLVNPIAPTF
uniref:Uncharacterized protein n=1 Tax=Arion vulgaris TaxID=1028688 RepID=A0A0B6ZT84_9EUPU